MKALANTVITLAAFLELSGEGAIDADDAVRALEEMACALKKCSNEERAALELVLRERIREARGNALDEMRVRELRFYSDFMESFDLKEPTA
jgi:hypothetical protein